MFFVSPDGQQTVTTAAPVEAATLRRQGFTRHDTEEDAQTRAQHVRAVLAARTVQDAGALPAASASKADWVKAATGAGLDETTAEAMTRDDLAAAFLPAPDQGEQATLVDGPSPLELAAQDPAAGDKPAPSGKGKSAGSTSS